MKPTWDHWPDFKRIQDSYVGTDPSYECLYRGRWNVHDDVDWANYDDLPWDYCSVMHEAFSEETIKYLYDNTGSMLWHDQNEESTFWKPVSYPN